jgi:hypothetical protein
LSGGGIIITSNISGFSSRDINGDITISGGSDIKGVSFGINCDKVTDSRIGTVISVLSNPVTFSLNVAVTLNVR